MSVPLEDGTTVLIGENNSGKTAFLSALRIVLSTISSGRKMPFDEYDFYMSKSTDSPENSSGIFIELWFRETNPNEWPPSIIQALQDIVMTDPYKDLHSIGLRLTCKYNEVSKILESKWEFLNLNGEPLIRKETYLSKFLTYIRLFYLSALRDSKDEFSPRSQFWGKILKDLKIPDDQKKIFFEELSKLNSELLKSDPRLEQTRATLEGISQLMSLETGSQTSIQALPLQPWDLLSKAQLVIRGRGSEVDFPLAYHGQGIQSLSVLFLFQAYIDVLLKPTFEPETEAILALEEPESHLHPQATRAIAKSLNALSSQKILSSHSTYFIQEIPLSKIRFFRRDNSGSKIMYVKRFFSLKISKKKELIEFCSKKAAKFDFDESASTLIAKGRIEESEFRDLLVIYKDEKELHKMIKEFFYESQKYLSDNDLNDLENFTKRIRGEILFARVWLLCEGQSEYLLLNYFAELMGVPFDQAGVSIIDFQNNGNPGVFIGLARVFEIPWIMTCDNDNEFKKFEKQIDARGVDPAEKKELVRPLPGEGMTLERYLARNGFQEMFLEILAEKEIKIETEKGKPSFENELVKKLESAKIDYARTLIEKIRAKKFDSSKIPEYFRNVITDITSKAS